MTIESTEYLFQLNQLRLTDSVFEQILIHCSKLNASDITLQTNQPIYAEIYGRILKITRRPLANNEVGEMLNLMYGPNGTAQLSSGIDVDTHYEVRPNRSERFRFRINATSCLVEGHNGIQLTARTIPTDPPALESMNLPQAILEAIAPTQGVVYVTGATGSGKSTLLASIIRYIAEQPDCHRKILTYESPIEFVYDHVHTTSAVVSQSEIPRHLPSFAAGVRNALRRKPHLILVGESRDTETISAVMEAAMTGHPVYTTLHSNGVSETIRRLVNTFPAAERHGRTVDLFETIRLLIWQKLVPTVDGKQVALREFLVFDENIRDQLLQTPIENVTAMTRQLLKAHGQTIVHDAERYYHQGIISDRTYQLILSIDKSMDQDNRVRE
ncbi:MAG: Dot/Icm type IV secretion system ATPase DotB [Gammaproteobacteria bacterium]|nr:Dot/Icm type IV secretion system ATPase DotB [Gammaproteobacteria bacterium]